MRGVEFETVADAIVPAGGLHSDAGAFSDTLDFFGYNARTGLLVGREYVQDLSECKTEKIVRKLEGEDS